MIKAKPFIKWVGGKSQLISQLEEKLPDDFGLWTDVTYIEPFAGGGAMLFHMLQTHPNIRKAVINDINPDLMTCYRTVRDCPEELVSSLRQIQDVFYSLKGDDRRKEFYLTQRDLFNTKTLTAIDNTTLFIFLNRTCFNGLYRVNKSGKFNVPCGRYASPTICDYDTIMADSRLLKGVKIMTGDFEATLAEAEGQTLFYFDPPYRPLSSTSYFNDYTKDSFNDDSQIRLKLFCDRIHKAGHRFMLSNSDCLRLNGADRFFDDLFADYRIDRVWAVRSVNAVGSRRGKITEILVRNYSYALSAERTKTESIQFKLAQ